MIVLTCAQYIVTEISIEPNLDWGLRVTFFNAQQPSSSVRQVKNPLQKFMQLGEMHRR